MSKYPSMPLFTDAYMADTRHLTAAQHGAYLLLLMTAWRMPNCRLPDDDQFLARCAAMDLRTWRKNKLTIMAFWRQDEQQEWYQARLVDERNHVEHLSSKNARAGRVSALKRKERDSTTVQPKPNENSTPIPIPIPSNVLSNDNTNPPVSPHRKRAGLDELSVDHIRDWLAEKRAQGRYLLHDEHFVLEKFKDYCRAKGKRYADYTAGYRNAFEWEKCQPHRAAEQRSNWLDEGDRLAEKYKREADNAR